MSGPGTNFRCSIVGNCAGQQIVQTFHVQQIAVSDTPEQDIKLAWDTSVKSAHLAFMATAYGLTSLNIIEEGGTGPGLAFGETGAGAITNNVIDTTSAAIITWRTAYRGRSGRGRMYMGPLPENEGLSGIVTGPAATRLETLVSAYMETFPASGPYALVVYSRKLHVGRFVTSHTVQANLGSQRRRRVGVGA